MRGRLFGLVAVFALAIASCGGVAGEKPATLSSGIGVHGAWTIDVIDPDGSVANHVEFDNALVSSGAQIIAELLSATREADAWKILAAKGGELAEGDSPCGAAGASVPCEISPGLALPGDGRLILQGSFVADIDGVIGLVTSQVSTCLRADSTGCSGVIDFTETSVGDPANGGARFEIAAGQTVDIEVEFSFGTLP